MKDSYSNNCEREDIKDKLELVHFQETIKTMF
jgi:hypothetical protein